jgi:hypothetical protein
LCLSWSKPNRRERPRMTKTGRRLTAGLCILLFLTAAILSIHSGNELRFLDEREYHNLAENLLHSKGYINLYGNPTVYRPPGYPFILTGIYALWQRPLAGKLVNALVLGLTAWLLASLAFPEKKQRAWLIPLLMICYPILAFTASTLYAQTMSLFLLAAFLYMFLIYENSIWSNGVAGLFYGMLLLVTPSFILLFPVFLLYRFFTSYSHVKKNFWLSMLVILCTLMVMTPWIFRNVRLTHTFMFISANSGENLLYGFSENTTPNSGPNTDISQYTEGAQGLSEAERDQYFRDQALTWIKQNPGRAFRLYALKVLNYFNYRNDLGTGSQSNRLRDLIMFITYYPLLILAVIRLFLHRRFPLSRLEILLYIVYFGNALLSAIFFTRIRFRLPFDALLIVIAAMFLGRFFEYIKERSGLSASQAS